jgi:hypothetical protein|tara:strand:- start:7192 stop:7473 length:282 start_codon:yes stop_codon:yes gene_type:complete
MNNTPHWVKPNAYAVKSIRETNARLKNDTYVGVTALRKSLLENNSFDMGCLSDSDGRAARRALSLICENGDEIPKHIFDDLRSGNFEFIKHML